MVGLGVQGALAPRKSGSLKELDTVNSTKQLLGKECTTLTE